MHEENHRESGGTIRFGEYELDPKRAVLSRRGIPLKIQPQPLRVLELLLLRAPRVVTREELSDYVWGNGVNVDLDQSLNFCVRQIRSVLNDSALDPKFIDTLPKQGYRFVGDVVREAAPVSAAVVSTVAGEPGPRPGTVHSWQTARDLSHELKWISDAGSQAGSPAVAGQSSRSRRERVAWATATTLLLGALAALGVAYFKRSDRPAMVVRSAIPSPPDNPFTPAGSIAWRPVLSPDGKQVVAPVLGSNGKHALWLRTLKDAGEGRVLPGTEGGTGPFWSPDGRSIGFLTTVDSKLKRIDLEGNLVQILSDVAGSRGAAWGPSGVILFTPTPSSPLYEIPATGGTPRQVTELNTSRKEQSHRWPVFLSDGRHFLFFVRSEEDPEVSGIYEGSLDSKEYHFVVKATAGPAFATGGAIVYMRDGILLTQAFDQRKLAVSGEPSALPDHVSFNAMGTLALFSISPIGDMIYYPAPPGGPVDLTWFDRNGRQINTTDPGGYVYGEALSPDGTHIVVNIMSPDGLATNLWDFDLKRGTGTRLTSGPEQKSSPVWQPDGQTVLFASRFTGKPGHIYRTRSDGSGGVETVLNFDSVTVVPGSVCRNGQYFAYTEVPEKSSGAIRILPFTGNRNPFSLAQIQFLMPPTGNGPQFSPDCKWIAYVSTVSGQGEVYLTHFPDSTRIYQVSTHGGSSPRWGGDGKELFYCSDDANVMAVNVNEKADGISLDTPRLLFHYVSIGVSRGFDVTPDGQRFLILTSNYSPSTPLTLVTNWNAELKTK
jgi:eukaryotic-like serine/threonine-protein kinase